MAEVVGVGSQGQASRWPRKPALFSCGPEEAWNLCCAVREEVITVEEKTAPVFRL